jgi:hypothetical protein
VVRSTQGVHLHPPGRGGVPPEDLASQDALQGGVWPAADRVKPATKQAVLLYTLSGPLCTMQQSQSQAFRALSALTDRLQECMRRLTCPAYHSLFLNPLPGFLNDGGSWVCCMHEGMDIRQAA